MKKILKNVVILVMCIVFVICNKATNVYAEVIEFCRLAVFCKGADYTKQIVFVLASNKGEYTALECSMDEDGYVSGATYLARNCEWKILEVIFEETGYAIKGIDNAPTDVIIIEDDASMMFTYEIVKSEENTSSDASNDTPTHGEEVKNETLNKEAAELKKEAENLFDNFCETTKSIKEDDSKFALYGGFLYEYLDFETDSTEQKWNEMSNYQRFVKYVLGICPYAYLKANNYVDAEDFIRSGFDNTGTREVLAGRGVNESTINAIIDCWKWEYVYYTTYGEFYDLSNGVDELIVAENENPEEIKEPEEPNEVKQETGSDTEQNNNEQSEENENGDTEQDDVGKSNRFLEYVKRNFITLTLLVLVGLGWLIMYLKRRSDTKKSNTK